MDKTKKKTDTKRGNPKIKLTNMTFDLVMQDKKWIHDKNVLF